MSAADTPDARTRIQAVLLDADGVVQLAAPSLGPSLEALCTRRDQTQAFLAEVFAAERGCVTGKADFRPALAEVLARWGSPVAVDDALAVWQQIDPNLAVLELVAALRGAGTLVALATNQQAYRAAFMTDGLGYARHFDRLLYSCELGFSKPDPQYFAAALAVVGVEPGAALFIDDHEPNVVAARDAGLQAEVFHISEGVARAREILRHHGLGGV